MSQSHPANANYYRRRAQTCATLANCAQSPADRARLTDMRDVCLTRAANEEWLDGLPPSPPANVAALAVVH